MTPGQGPRVLLVCFSVPDGRQGRAEERLWTQLLRHPRFSQALFVFGEIFRPVGSQPLSERGNAQARIALPQLRDDLLRLLRVSRKRVGGSDDVAGGVRIHGHCRPFCRFFITAGEEMRVRRRSLHVGDERIERAQAHGAREVFDGHVRVAEPHSCPTAVEPRPCNVRIERNRPID